MSKSIALGLSLFFMCSASIHTQQYRPLKISDLQNIDDSFNATVTGDGKVSVYFNSDIKYNYKDSFFYGDGQELHELVQFGSIEGGNYWIYSYGYGLKTGASAIDFYRPLPREVTSPVAFMYLHGPRPHGVNDGLFHLTHYTCTEDGIQRSIPANPVKEVERLALLQAIRDGKIKLCKHEGLMIPYSLFRVPNSNPETFYFLIKNDSSIFDKKYEMYNQESDWKVFTGIRGNMKELKLEKFEWLTGAVSTLTFDNGDTLNFIISEPSSL